MSSTPQATPRPDVAAKTERYAAQNKLQTPAMVLGGVRAAAAGSGFMSGAFGPGSLAIMYANPKGRLRQVAADQTYLGVNREAPMYTARTADHAAGLPSFLKKKSANPQLPLGLSLPPLRGATGRVVDAGDAFDDLKNVARGSFTSTAADDVLDNLGAPLSRRARALGEKALRPSVLTRGLSRVPAQVLAAAVGAPLLVGSYMALDGLYRGGSRARNRLAEGRRFERAMGGLDPADFGDPSFEARYEADPEGMTAALRETFGVINRIAPSVARDPIIAREYMRRMLLDPSYRQPPEEYVRQVDALASLENRLQGTAPSLMDGFGSVAAAPLKLASVESPLRRMARLTGGERR